MIRVIHQLNGRARFQVPGLRGSSVLSVHLERELQAHQNIFCVSASSTTGNVLVLFAEFETSFTVATLIQEALKGVPEVGAVDSSLEPSEVRLPGGGQSKRKAKKLSLLQGEGGLDFSLEESDIPWHTMEVGLIAHNLKTSLSEGLSADLVRERQAMYGLNSLPTIPTQPLPQLFKNQM